MTDRPTAASSGGGRVPAWQVQTTPDRVHEVLRRSMLVDGYEFVLDPVRSRGSRLVDARDGTSLLDMFGFFASSAVGMNHPALADDPAFLATLAQVAVNKPSNSDVYTTHLADFVATFARVLGDPRLPHLFLIEGGALAVENALKTAFDWKRRHNAQRGRDPERGTRVLHLRHAFHGRSGYTLSLTNTDPAKTALFPAFDWPRIDSPAVRFPVDAHLAEVEADEARALAQARAAFAAFPDDIACFLAEPIQAEGGDRHLRGEFLREMQELCSAHDALFVLDEVQTGCGMTGTPWAYQQLGLEPDVVAFGKKLQVCGIMAGGRLSEIDDHVFAVSSRLNSTWGGNLTDMVRATRILQVIDGEELIDAAARTGAALLGGLEELCARHGVADNPRGRGLMVAVDLPDTSTRDAVVSAMLDDEHVLVLSAGPRSLRLRPALTVSNAEVDEALAALDRVLSRTAAAVAA